VTDARRGLGALGEARAATLLAERGIAFLARNARTRFGELDLVGRERNGCYVFVEVKTRREGSPVPAAEAVDRRKLERLARLGEAWLAARGLRGEPWRIALVAITVGREAERLDWIDVD